MTLPLPNLDDRFYGDLVQEAIDRIPVECPTWTDHNPSDVGIMVIELLAWLTEMTLYQVNQVPDRNVASFLSLLKGESWEMRENLTTSERQAQLKAEIHSTLKNLRQRYRAITPADYEGLILEEWNTLTPKQYEQQLLKYWETLPKDSPRNEALKTAWVKVARLRVFPKHNLEAPGSDPSADQDHISLVVVPQPGDSSQNGGHPLPEQWQQALQTFLEPRRLLTTRLHVVEYSPKPVYLVATLVLENGAKPDAVKNQTIERLQQFFNPLPDPQNPYWAGQGWPFGRSVYRSELFALLDGINGVDYVKTLGFTNDQGKTLDAGGNAIEDPKLLNNLLPHLTLAGTQLAHLQISDSDFAVDLVQNTLSFSKKPLEE